MRLAQKKIGRVALIAGLLITAGVLAWVLFSPRQPAFQGKTLTAWAEQYGSNHLNSLPVEEAEFAIRQIGTNGIPFLLDFLRAKPSKAKTRLREALPTAWWTGLHLHDESARLRRAGAHGLVALGTNAAAAVPAVIELAARHPMDDGPYPDDDGRYVARFVLVALGPTAEPAIPFFVQCLTNADAQLDAIAALGQFGTKAKPAVPVLLTLLNDPSPNVRKSVTNWLPRIDPQAAADARVLPPH